MTTTYVQYIKTCMQLHCVRACTFTVRSPHLPSLQRVQDYKVAVEREGGRKETIFRRYREFHEFNEKLKEACPGVQLPALPEKLLFQRSHVQQVSVACLPVRGRDYGWVSMWVWLMGGVNVWI